MSARTESLSELRTLADHVRRLDGIPLGRIRSHPFPGTATEKDLLAAADQDGYFCELVEGALVEKPESFRESLLAGALIEILRVFARAQDLGRVAGEQGMVRLHKGLVRSPDVAFYSWRRFPDRHVPKERVPDLAPDLAVEILSESNTAAEMARKRKEYFAAGTKLVWEIDPRTRAVRVYTRPNRSRELSEADILEGGKVLPGFSLPLRDLFAELD